MPSSNLPTPSIDEIKSWDENRICEHFQHPALKLKPEYAEILRDQEIDGKALFQLTKEDLLGPPYNLLGGPVTKIMVEVARLRGTSAEAISQSAINARFKKTEAELEELKRDIELVRQKIESTMDEKEKEHLCKDRTELRQKEYILLDILKEQLQAPSSNLALIVHDIKRDTEKIKNDAGDIKIDTRCILSSLDELHGKVDSLPKLLLDLHEDIVPRLFYIFPEDGHWLEPSIDSLFTKKFRLFFLCEHETIEKGSTKKQFHLAYHEGYPVARPREFVDKYGSYIRTIMPCLILAVRLGGRLMECVPVVGKTAAQGLQAGSDIASTAYKATESSFFMESELDFCAQTEDFFRTVMDTDKQITTYATDAPSSVQTHEATSGVIERPELRELQAYLEGVDNANRLGNLQRVLRRGENGSITVRWVCKNHASEWETTNTVRSLQAAIKDGYNGCVKFDNETWELMIWGLSRSSLRKFRNSVTRLLSGLPLRKIRIGNCEIADSEDVEALIHAVPTVEILELPVMKNMRVKNIILKCLQLREFNISGSDIGITGASALAEALKMNTNLQDLNLHNNGIGEEGACALAKALEINERLKTLNLWYNGIGKKGATALAEALLMNRRLQNLNLESNVIGVKGAGILAEALKINTGLQNLSLTNNGIGENGASALAELLMMNTNMQNLNLSHNSIGEKGAIALAEALKINTGLQNLNLGSNNIGEKGTSELAEALKMNTSLKTLDLASNGIGEKGANALAEVLKMSTSLQNLNLRNNGIDEKGALAEALKMNKVML